MAREDSGRVLAVLARRLGDVHVADDAVQDALVQALVSWPTDGVPHNPAGWLMTVATRKALDRLRRGASQDRRLQQVGADLLEADEPAVDRRLRADDGTPVADDQLRLALLCCHPALHRDARVALTLRLVGGLTVEEIAAAYVVPPATITQRIVRAKRKIRDAGIPLTVPADLDSRVGSLLTVLYLVFSEGHLSRGPDPLRADLADEAVRLARLVRTLVPGSPEVDALLALMLFQRARFDARLDDRGELVLLADQDRSRWDRTAIAEANRLLSPRPGPWRPGPYTLQALAAGLHANAPSPEATDWRAIAAVYTQLARLDPSPMVAVNRAVAVGMSEGPSAGLAVLAGVPQLSGHHLWHAVAADLHQRAGDVVRAGAAYRQALALAPGQAERRHLEGRLAGLPDEGAGG